MTFVASIVRGALIARLLAILLLYTVSCPDCVERLDHLNGNTFLQDVSPARCHTSPNNTTGQKCYNTGFPPRNRQLRGKRGLLYFGRGKDIRALPAC